MTMFKLIAFGVMLIAEIAAQSCLNPAGNDCSWYIDCLEKTITCGRDGYAIKYATHYCNRYENNAKHFSQNGQQWISDVKRCLQRKLAPMLKKTPQPSCQEIKNFAFQTHVDCYTDPSFGGPSFCKLGLKDYLQVFKTIKGAFLQEFKQTVKGGWNTLWSCWHKGRKR